MKRISLLLCILFGASLTMNTVCSDEQTDDDEYTVDESDDSEDETTDETEEPAPAVETSSVSSQQSATPTSTTTPETKTNTIASTIAHALSATTPAAPAPEEKTATPATDTQEPKSATENQASVPPTQSGSTPEAEPSKADQAKQETEDTADTLTNSETPELDTDTTTDNTETPAQAIVSSSALTTESVSKEHDTIQKTDASQVQVAAEQPSTPTKTEQQEAVSLPTLQTIEQKEAEPISPVPDEIPTPSEQQTVAETPQRELAPPIAAPVAAPTATAAQVMPTQTSPVLSPWTSDFSSLPSKPPSISAQEIANQMRALPSSQVPTVEQELENTVLTGPLTGKSLKQAMTQLAPLIMTRSVEKAVEQFTNLPADRALEILEHLINTSRTDFSKKGSGRPFEIKRNDLLQIIFGVASQYRDPALYRSFFNLIDQHPGLEHGMRPILFVLSISSYPVLIPDVIEWLEDKGHTNCVDETARYAIDRTSGRSLRALAAYAPALLKPLLGSLLLYAIGEKKSRIIISALINAGANVNYQDPSGYTPLIKAVEMGDLAITRLLMSNGGDSDLVVKDEVGSAWQKASELHNELITQYLEAQYAKQPRKALKTSSFSDIREPTAH